MSIYVLEHYINACKVLEVEPTSQVEKGNVEVGMVKGRVFINQQGRYQIKGTSYYFTSGDSI